MKKTWSIILKVIIAVAGAIAGVVRVVALRSGSGAGVGVQAANL